MLVWGRRGDEIWGFWGYIYRGGGFGGWMRGWMRGYWDVGGRGRIERLGYVFGSEWVEIFNMGSV